MNTESRREFEEWANDKYLLLRQDQFPDYYRVITAQAAWEAWQAARERQSKELHEWKSNYKQLASHHNKHCTCSEIY